jgi:hypothetical protein
MFSIFQPATTSEVPAVGVLGSVTQTTQGRENWVGEGWIGYLRSDSKLICGRWHHRGHLWEFTPDDSKEIEAIWARAEWEVLDGYWGERAKLVLDESRLWLKTSLEFSAAVRLSQPADVWHTKATETDMDENRVEGHWDHEHCAICCQKLGHGGEHVGYICTQGVWICEHCYLEFVQQRSLTFIVSGASR